LIKKDFKDKKVGYVVVEKGGGKPLLPNSKRRAFHCALVIFANWIKYAIK
jgi:hypothetical protein